ncbi:MAG: ABC transporter permease [Peptococcaceae bacterium]
MLIKIGNTFWREFKGLCSQKRIWVILFFIPISYTLLFGCMYSNKTIRHLKLAVVNESPGQLSRSVIQGFAKSDKFTLSKELDSAGEAVDLMQKDEIDVVLVIPEGFTESIKKGSNTTIFIGANGTNMTMSNTAMTGAAEIIGAISAGIAVKKFEARGQREEQALDHALPISFLLRPWYNPAGNYSNFLLLGYLTAVIQQVILYFAAISISEERRKGTLQELVAKGKYPASIILGKFLPYVVLGLVGWMANFQIAVKIFDYPMEGSYGDLIILSAAFIACICAIGIFLSIIARNSLDATQYAMLVALPSFLISGYTWPIAAMTGFYKILAQIFPLTYFAENVRKIALMGAGFNIIRDDIHILVTVAGVFLILSGIAFKFKYLRKKQPGPGSL